MEKHLGRKKNIPEKRLDEAFYKTSRDFEVSYSDRREIPEQEVKRKHTEEIKALKEVIAQLESENRTLKTRIDLMQQRLEENTDVLKRMHTDFNESLMWLENILQKREKVSLT